jgi:hypothetical protein
MLPVAAAALALLGKQPPHLALAALEVLELHLPSQAHRYFTLAAVAVELTPVELLALAEMVVAVRDRRLLAAALFQPLHLARQTQAAAVVEVAGLVVALALVAQAALA